ncbi:uncharacterized protein L3040_005012 [Drepanopeziza brunnea f. sp. 'multigermtubi']|uniref:uncharacterized protein n=1 Tax=Drepanopeziza brunnea f. sp. 'multigermtubi' TaxID=698441 RepID=UPI0023A2065A|nr:hypothetical protein L3040_005012 [Drepanopeziza brunnea f. sp. 'multigermtubi']
MNEWKEDSRSGLEILWYFMAPRAILTTYKRYWSPSWRLKPWRASEQDNKMHLTYPSGGLCCRIVSWLASLLSAYIVATKRTEGRPRLTNGDDGHADVATSDFIVSPFSQRRHFYGDILRMRHIATFEASSALALV